MADISVIDGPVPVVVLIVGAIALVILLARRGRAALVTVAIAAGVALVTLLGLNWLLTRGLSLFPETLPTVVTLWISLGTAAVVLVVGNLVGTTVGRKVLAVGSGLAVLLAAGSQINVYFAEYPTLGALAGAQGDVSPLTGTERRPSASVATPVVDRWTGPATGTSQVLTAPIPGIVSGFTARDAYVYLPAAYSSPQAPLLPVLILVSGQPGAPQDWIVSGRLQTQLDQFAAANGGLAPVTVVVDPNGPNDTITMCMDSDIARADTYLSQDVPNWITSELGVDANHAHWAFGGFSYGGTCAIQMATRHTQLYPSFIDISGEREPAISAERTQTIQAAFGGDTAAFDALTPLTLLSEHRYPDVWGFFAAGADDGEFLPAMTEVSAAAQKAGMTVHTQTVLGQGHSWAVP
jgi:enterochelin esterase-like enzyme